MALFKILKGTEAKLPTNKVEGYCYVTTDTKKMYVDTSASTRICLNAANADTATKLAEAKTIEITGAVKGSVKFDGSADVNIVTSLTSHTHKVKDIQESTYQKATITICNKQTSSGSTNLVYNTFLWQYSVGDTFILQIDDDGTRYSGTLSFDSSNGQSYVNLGDSGYVLSSMAVSETGITINPALPSGTTFSLFVETKDYYLPVKVLDPEVVQRSELDTYSFITTDDIDTICGQSIVAASEVTF